MIDQILSRMMYYFQLTADLGYIDKTEKKMG